ncbi:unnamed protein product [Effrenium voratum]|nr:unnamed protein product [Effrenium voratum]
MFAGQEVICPHHVLSAKGRKRKFIKGNPFRLLVSKAHHTHVCSQEVMGVCHIICYWQGLTANPSDKTSILSSLWVAAVQGSLDDVAGALHGNSPCAAGSMRDPVLLFCHLP